MSYFSRRIIQRCLDENATFLLGDQLDRHVQLLNQGNRDSLAAEWEVVLLRAFSEALDEMRAQIGTPETHSSGYAGVQQILADAAGAANPRHGGHGRFWQLPYDQFMALPPIYGQPLIATDGPDRGARSGLVQVLRGSLPGFPRMPLPPLDPVADEDIQRISDWIEAGCP